MVQAPSNEADGPGNDALAPPSNERESMPSTRLPGARCKQSTLQPDRNHSRAPQASLLSSLLDRRSAPGRPVRTNSGRSNC
jgi:hypothetical protein